MKTPCTHHRRIEGAVMIIALFVVILGAVILGSWVQLIATRQRFAESALTGQNRRIALDNARSLARQYMLSNMVDGTIAATTNTVSWGGFTVTNQAANLWGNSDPAYINPSSLFGSLRYGATINVRLVAIHTNNGTAITNVVTNVFQARTRNPVIAGFPLVLHNSAGVYAGTPATNIYWTSVSGFPGFPRIPFTSGRSEVVGDTGYLGYLPSPPQPVNAYQGHGEFPTNSGFLATTNSSGTNSIQIILELAPIDSLTNSIIRYTTENIRLGRFLTNGTPTTNTNNVMTNPPVTGLILRGAPSGETNKVVHIVVGTNATNLSSIVLSGSNTRRVYINVTRSTDSSLTLTATNSPGAWRAGITLSRTALTAVGNPSLIGGIRSDRSVSGTITFTAETNAGGLDAISDRVMWLEDFRTP
jgi:type II secretory pathway pseudopilin PulG